MEADKSPQNAIRQLALKYPTIPIHKIQKQMKKYNNNISQVEQHLQEKEKNIKTKTNLTEEQLLTLSAQFPKFGLDFLYQKARTYDNIEDFRKRLKGFEKRGKDTQKIKQNYLDNQEKQWFQQFSNKRQKKTWGKIHKKNYSRDKEKVNNQMKNKHHYHCYSNEQSQLSQKLDTSAVIQEISKLFPKISKKQIQWHVQKMCCKLSKVSKKQLQENKPQNYEQNILFICQATGIHKKQVQRQFQKLEYNLDGTIQCLLSQQNNVISSSMLIPQNISHIYIDGNNLLYVNKQIRDITIQKGKTPGSIALSKVIDQFNKVLNKDVLLIFDHMKQAVPKFQNIRVEISKPKYRSSDDHLIDLSQRLRNQGNQSSLFVTSDKKLLESLHKNKSDLMRSKIFMTLLEQVVANIREIVKMS